jgi:hypothetical protein
MPRKIKDVTKDYLVNVALPVHGQTYTVISHQSIIDYAYAELANQGFGIINEEYRSTLDGQIAQGIYRLQYGTDPEMNVMFAWTNSYNKQIRFKCATGGYVNANQTVMLAGQLGNYARKHTGTADADVIASMQAQITDATMYYNQLVADKEVMKTISLTSRKQAELLGILFAEYEILTTEQASIIRQQMDKPSYFYNGGKDTLWAFYNHCTVALQQSHPRSWMEDQRMLHWVISNEFDLTTPAIATALVAVAEEPVVDPLLNNYGQPENQTNLLIQLAEETGDTELLDVLKAQHPVTPEEAFKIHVESDQEYLERVAEIEGEPEVMELSDNQAVQEEVENEEVLYQSEEVVEDVVEDIEVPFDIDEDDDAVLGSILVPIEKPEPPVTVEEYLDHKESSDETVVYTDPVGNVFEAPVVESKAPQEFIDALVNAPEMEASEVDMSKVTWVDAPETVKEIEIAPERVKFAIDDDFDLSLDFNDEKSDDDLFL